MLTAYATPKLAVEAIKAGAIDYLAKPFAPEELLHAVARCAERHRLLRENAALRSRAGEIFSLDQIVGESAKMRELRKLIQTVAPTDARVLILGESGTGQGTRRRRAAQPEPTARGKLCPHQLRRDSRNPSGKRIVRPRKRRVHRRVRNKNWGASRKPMAARFFSMKSPT